jgi:hypothetical protein
MAFIVLVPCILFAFDLTPIKYTSII